MWRFVRHRWSLFWQRAPRQLSFTRSGKVLIAIAFAAGLAAINTGNNLLFLGWGMVLSAIVLSGILSEATLKIVRMRTGTPDSARAGEPVSLPLVVLNEARRLPAYGVEVDVQLDAPAGRLTVPAPYQLRIGPGEERPTSARFVPEARGFYHFVRLRSRTSYPFGFFEKSRRFRPAIDLGFWVAPRAVDVRALSLPILARLGDEPAHRAGLGDDYFSLRPYRAGDDPRRVHWRRSARTGRWVVIETEAQAAREVMLELHLGSSSRPAQVEHCIEVFGSLAELLLERGFSVGVLAPGTLLSPDRGARQHWAILLALAKLDPGAAKPRERGGDHAVRVAVAASGAAVDNRADATVVVRDDDAGTTSVAATFADHPEAAA